MDGDPDRTPADEALLADYCVAFPVYALHDGRGRYFCDTGRDGSAGLLLFTDADLADRHAAALGLPTGGAAATEFPDAAGLASFLDGRSSTRVVFDPRPGLVRRYPLSLLLSLCRAAGGR